tara:strand:- start:5852 stop:7405 length:1554 start_codon:yes stop_codon:yes gene_type:complete
MGSIAKAVKRVIPKEIQPILPIAASMFAGPLIGAKLSGIQALATRPVLTQALASGLTSAGTDFLTSGKVDPKTLLTSTLMGAGGQYFKDVGAGNKGIMGLDLSERAREQFSNIGNLMAPTGVDSDTRKFDISGDIIKSGATAATAGGSIAAYNAAEEAQREYDEMMAGKEADAAADRQARIDYITRYMNMAGFSQDEIDDALARSGYRTGGRVGLMGTRVGYKIGGSTMQNILARLFNVEVPAERLEEMRQNRADFLFNENVDAEDYPSQDYLNKVRNASEKQATKELEEYMKKIGMDLLNPPEDSMSDKLIDQIMEPRKEGRVKEAKGGRIGLKEGGTGDVLFDTYRDAFSELIGYPGYVIQDESEFLNDLLEDPDDLSMKEIKAQMKSENTPIAKYLNRLPKDERKEALRLLRDKYADLGEYYKPKEEKYLEKRGYMAEGGIMDLKMGGMPAEMDLRGGGFVPIGAKEKADDVPARLSKNEFVMTADAVRAAGGGSVNKGAKRMYDLMNKLEARV